MLTQLTQTFNYMNNRILTITNLNTHLMNKVKNDTVFEIKREVMRVLVHAGLSIIEYNSYISDR